MGKGIYHNKVFNEDDWINDLIEQDNKELFKLLPYLSLGLQKYKPNKLSKSYKYGGGPHLLNEELKKLNILVPNYFLKSTKKYKID